MLSRERGYTADLARALNCLGWARLLEGDHERARDSYAQSLAMYTELGNGAIAAESLEGLACAAGPRGDAGRSASLFGAAEAAGYYNVPARGALREPYLAAARSVTRRSALGAAEPRGSMRTRPPSSHCRKARGSRAKPKLGLKPKRSLTSEAEGRRADKARKRAPTSTGRKAEAVRPADPEACAG